MKSTHKTGKINTHKNNISKVNINLYNKISIINNHSTINSRLRRRKNQYRRRLWIKKTKDQFLKNGGFGL